MDNAPAQPGAHAPITTPVATNGPPPQPNFGSYGPPQGNIGQPQGPQPGYVPSPDRGSYGPPQGGYGPPQGPYGPPQGAGGPPQATFPHPQTTGGPPQPAFPPPQGNMYGSGPPIFNQPPIGSGGGPPAGDWMMRPQNIPNCPPGLEYLTMIDSLIVNQVEFLETVPGRQTENQYVVTNSIGQKVYYAQEESDGCTKDICGSKRAFHMKILDNFGNQVINLNRPLACQACCFPCWLQSMEVTAPPGTPVGIIEQEWNLLYPIFAIKTTTGETILRIKGPFCTMNCYADVEFQVLSADGSIHVGKISKKWSGYAREASPKADIFGISFPMDLDVRMKAVMLGACFLIDMMYFEQTTTIDTTKTDSNQPQHSSRQQQDIKPI